MRVYMGAWALTFGEKTDGMAVGRFLNVTNHRYASPLMAQGDAIRVLLDLTENLGNKQSLEDSLSAITDAALVLLGADHASVRLLDTTKESLLCSARSGVGMEHPPLEFRRGQGVVGWVVDHREGLAIEDTALDDRFVRSENQRFTVGSIVAEPLWSSGDVIGVLCVSSARASAFGDEDRLLARLLANCSIPPVERARLRRLAIIDDLTLAYNARHLMPQLQEEMLEARRSSSPLSFLLMDLDHFKSVNDLHGHAVGDAVLRTFADRVRSLVRRTDILIRRGGEEFALLMPRANEREARAIADRIRETLCTEPFVSGGITLAQTVSIGVATWDGEEGGPALERRADLAMYDSKARGRNRVTVASKGSGKHPATRLRSARTGTR
jgi:two-component system, cell cycle response regulator